ncbi:MAG: ATP-grasp domain-containing protein [Myxococcales bacterium]|nr:ATP-grasp domain-containing protein [Myxococcales bacterium]
MKIAIIYNRDSKNVINLFGMPNRERYGLKAIKRISDALKKGGHQSIALEGDKDLVDRLQEFMPQALKGERPGMAFNLSYGIQGQARYTHVPGILEMVGIPYVGSGPLAHSLALDKVVAKVLFQQSGLPTPEWAVLDAPDAELPELPYPLIVKPRSEAVSFGIRVVHSDAELRDAANLIFEEFHQPVLVEQFIEGREINVGLLGNGEPQAFPPAELDFGDGLAVYTEEDKKGKSGRTIGVVCPAPLTPEQTAEAQTLARRAFRALGCYDCARVDMRLDADGNFYILELNSLPSLGEHGSYIQGAAAVGLDFPQLINRLVEVASERYFGTQHPPALDSGAKTPAHQAFSYLSRHRDKLEKRVETLVGQASRTGDPIALGALASDLDDRLREAGLLRTVGSTESQSTWLWESEVGLEGGTLLIAHLDVPLSPDTPSPYFRRTPEWLYGEGAGTTAAPLAMLEYALRSLRAKRLRGMRLGVLLYADEGFDCRYSREAIARTSGLARRVLVLRPGNAAGVAITRRRGQRSFRLRVEGAPRRLGQKGRGPDPLQWLCRKVDALSELSSSKERVSVALVDLRTRHLPQHLPHRVDATLLLSYPESAVGDRIEEQVRELLGQGGRSWSLERTADRPPLRERRGSQALAEDIAAVAREWDIPFGTDSSSWPSAAGLVPAGIPVICGMGPTARGLNTADEAVNRVSLVQRTLLLAELLAGFAPSP